MRWCAIFCALLAAVAHAEDYYVLPFKPDPAIVADGDLADWGKVPNALTINQKANVTHGVDTWTGPEDLSGTIHLAWRGGMLAVAATITDSSFLQPYTARDVWKGDHINVWMDFTPGVEPQRRMFGQGQFHVVLSPGNFGSIDPEIYVYRPEGQNPGPGQVAARRTETGYIVEAVIPVQRLKIDNFSMFKDANFEVAISDADAAPAKQEGFMTYGTDKWVYSRDRMLPMVFGDGNGNAPPPIRGTKLADHTEILATKSHTFTFNAGDIPEGKAPFIYFRARFPYKTIGGFIRNSLSLELNGQPIGGDRIANRKMRATVMGGKEHTFINPDGKITVYYTPKYGIDVTRHSHYGTLDGTDPTEYEFTVHGLIKKGENTLTITNHLQSNKDHAYNAQIDELEYRIKVKVPPPAPPKPAPTGPIPWVAPMTSFPKTYAGLKQSTGTIRFNVRGQSLAVTSRFSTPDGQWQTGTNSHFKHNRKIIEHNEWIEVRDTFTNLTDDNLPIMQEHSCALGDDFREAWLGGLKSPTGNGTRAVSDNPSVFATTDKIGIGMYPTNDVFLVHTNQVAKNGTISINDHQYYIPPKQSYTASFAIVPVAKSDFWTFINAARRARNVNFELKWMFAFMFHHWPVYEWTEARFRSFVDHKGADLLVQSNTARNKKGRYARATDFVNADLSVYHDFQKRVRGWYPKGNVKTGIYYHCFLDTTRENDEKFKADRGLDSAGNHINYGGSGAYAHLFIPTLQTDHWGEEMIKVMKSILDNVQADGIFWDEFTRSRVDYIYSHEDGSSANIDKKTHKIIRTKGSAALISLPFRVERVDRIQREDRPFIINGAPNTRTMVDKHFMAFTETGSMTNCRQMLLHSPVALGDHLTEKKYADSYKNIHAAMDHGCLFSWYSHIFHDFVAPTKYMFPSTPIELYSGIHIARERILTNRSGNYGWGDSSTFEPHVFNHEGREDPNFKVPVVKHNGANYGELRLPEGYYAILVRKGGG